MQSGRWVPAAMSSRAVMIRFEWVWSAEMVLMDQLPAASSRTDAIVMHSLAAVEDLSL